ncbi:GIY-YIG nuclease family protein [Chryseobacterium sp. MP_3.2]|uniref:GIY-YIG nuclease family protein n=1 Tax=Chryseobacterium sp. MP_3.2 TaxID=3071712 RepID=UPI002DF908F5|nr:putative endonuclease [Chryseobacterium sp. MP_3.2]
MKTGFIYILTNLSNTTLYIGVTSNLPQRILEHREKKYPGSFTSKYNIGKLVYWEAFSDITDAIGREKQLKAGSRQKKIDLIASINPMWNDLFDDIQNVLSPFD